MKIKVKANKQLFDRWRKFNPQLASIVQNDMEISDEQLQEWRVRYLDHVKKMHQEYMQKVAEISELVQETAVYIEQCRKR